MKIFDEETVLIEVQKHQSLEGWVQKARENSRELKALITGEGFHEELINKIEGLESDVRSIARKKYSKDIRDVFQRINKKRDNVFQANGGSEEIKIEEGEFRRSFIEALNNFKGGKSITKYLSEYFFRQLDTDPNGLIFLEYKTEPELKIYPTYKSINDIRHYDADGQKVSYVIFEPKKKINEIDKSYFLEWRVVDSQTDWTIKQIGSTFVVDTEKTFTHEFGEAPGIVLSEYLKIGEKARLSPMTPVIEIAKDFARDKSILTIYKFQNGFPKNWQYVTQCRSCHGTAKTKDGKNCSACGGTGILQKKDVTDMINLQPPKEGDPILAPNVAGFISPDLETWKQYKEDLRDFEMIMDDTIWGTDRYQQSKGAGKETATGRFIDVQPVSNELNRLTDNVEWVHNTLANWVANLIIPTKQKEEKVFHKSYGRRFIIESPDVILEKYQNAKKAGDGTTILDKLLHEFILSKYKTDPFMQERMLKKAMLEPYIHYSIETVNDIFGADEAFKKAIFGDFWQSVDISQDFTKLAEQFKTYTYERISSRRPLSVEP